MIGPIMSLKDELTQLQKLADRAISLWDNPAKASARLINISENATFLVESEGFKSVLRVHRENYHTVRAIECELIWLQALRADQVVMVANVIPGRDGQRIQRAGIEGLMADRFLVMFEFLEGAAPVEKGDLTAGFETLGEIAARCHDHVQDWQKPGDFERLTWDVDAVFGNAPTWGNWREAPGVTQDICNILVRVEERVSERLARFGKSPERYNLIHADMRLANLLVDGSVTRVVDFDDSGFGWFMYDFAAAISFIENDPRIPDLQAAWLRGYRRTRHLSSEDEAEIPTMIMLRRMALLAWIGSHIEAPEPQALASDFAKNTASLGITYLRNA